MMGRVTLGLNVAGISMFLFAFFNGLVWGAAFGITAIVHFSG